MDFDVGNIILSIIFGTFGLIYFRYGRRLSKVSWMVVGVILMVYPYFVSSRIWMTVLGVVFMLVPRYVWRS